MKPGSRWVAPLTLLLLACESPQAPPPDTAGQATLLPAGPARTSGGGFYSLQGEFPIQFAFTAVQLADGRAAGQFHQKGDVGGVWVEVAGQVTCLAVDAVNGRGWIGGVVTENRSDADLQDAIHQPGQDVWFRFVDHGAGDAAQPDRTSFLGFTGAAGIITSEEYCAARIWPDADARTHAVTSGNIEVR